MDNIEEVELEEDVEVEKVKKKKKGNGKWINIISNIFFIPVMIILVVYLMYAISVQKDNGVPSFFGQSYVKVLSDSMKPGFKRGDVVVIERVNISEIKAADANEKNGSIIAFYKASLKNSSSKYDLFNEKQPATKDFKTGKETKQSAIIFHQVIGIYYDEVGNTWFETKGTNSTADTDLVRGDYVIGQYKASVMAGIIQFISSTNGMIMLIIVPSCVLLFLLLLNIIEIIDQMMREKKEKGAIAGDVKERELEVATMIEEEGVTSEEQPVKRTRRRRATEENQETSAEESVEAPAEEVKPRRRRKVEESTETAEEQPVETPAEEKPARRRRAAAIEPIQETTEPAVEEKPVRRRRVASETAVEEKVGTPASTEGGAIESAAERRRRRRLQSADNDVE